MDAAVAVAFEPPSGRSPDRRLAWPIRWSAVALVAATWISAGIFGAYIVAFYAGSAFNGSADLWNEILPGLHDTAAPAATGAIALHFVAGGILLMLGPVQLLGSVRRRMPWLHRWTGRLYVFAAVSAGLGGLAFIGLKGTIGGPVMNAGFALYGALPNLAVAELFIRSRKLPLRGAGVATAVVVLLAATAFVVVATVFFTTRLWGPGIRIGLAL